MTLARIATIALMLCAGPALADDATPPMHGAAREQLRQACAGDISRYCPNLEPGGGRISRCLHENEEKLSDGCKAARAEARSHMEHKTGGQ
jgi:hypothetical protein